MNPAEQDLISLYLNERQALKGTLDQTVEARANELAAAVKILNDLGGSLDTITTSQALAAVNGIRNNSFSNNYSHKCIQTFKSFLLWYADNGGNLNTKKLKDIKTPGMDFHTKKREDILNEDEFEKAMEACTNSRDRAILALLWDGSFRPGEIIGLTWGDLIRDEYGIRLLFKTPKTGFERPIRLTYAVPYLNLWEKDYPGKPENSSPLFMQTVKHSHQYEPLTKDGLSMFIRRLRKKTGIKKLAPSIFRPSKITSDVEHGTDLQYVMIKNWGSLRTTMIDVYAKPSTDYVDKIALQQAGIKKEAKVMSQPQLVPLQCPKCGTLNPTGAQYCMICRSGLTEEATITQADLIEMLAQIARDDPDRLLKTLQNYAPEKEK